MPSSRWKHRNRLVIGRVLLCMCCFAGAAGAEEPDGRRPYEFEWAGRVFDDHPPLADFENLEGWRVDQDRGSAAVTLSREQFAWGRHSAKVTFRGHPAGAEFLIRPPKPIPVGEGFSEINLWVWADVWSWDIQPQDRDPWARLGVVIEAADGAVREIPFSRDIDWPGWFLLHVRLSADDRERFRDGGLFKGIKLGNCRVASEQRIFLDNLSFHHEDLSGAIDYEVLPRPGVDLAPGQTLGVHTGPGRLPFPTREETLLPDQLAGNFATDLRRDGDSYVFRYQGDDGVLEYRYEPQRGDLGDITARWMGGEPARAITPMHGGGVRLKIHDETDVEGLVTKRFGNYEVKEPLAHDPDRREMLACRIDGDTVVAKWKLTRGGQSAVVEYVFRLWQKSLVTDIHCAGGEAGEVTLGSVENAADPRLIPVPYWVGRPKVLMTGPADRPLFLTSFVDHYRTGASQLFFPPRKEGGSIICGGGTRYLPKTDGRRNDCHERLFLTISPRFEEVLPTIPNPPSRWRDTAADYLVCYYAVKDREKDYQHWKKIARYGMDKVIQLDWETCWRDDAESFTFRTTAAPGKGGDADLAEYIRKVQALGFRYALYNNYVDYAPVSATWDEDMVSRLPDGNWQQAWFRTYLAKPSRAVAFSREMTAIMQDKFQPLAAGPDVHTALIPWTRVDYDARMPGAGTAMSQFYAYGQLLHEQQQIWNGPVYGECGNNYYYSGLITGSGASDAGYDFGKMPWLPDFYLRKMHPLGCNWSLGYRGGGREIDLDRYLARTIAFGLPGGFLGGWRRDFDHHMLRGYFMLQQLQSDYCKAHVRDIRYAAADGRLMGTSQALATGACGRNQIRLTYDNGLDIWVNGHPQETWMTPEAELPPFGYFARSRDGRLRVSSALENGHRADYVHSPAYDYVDGRGRWFKTSRAASDGKLIVLHKDDGSRELIPYQAGRFAIAVDRAPTSAVALDLRGDELGPVTGVLNDGWFQLKPHPDAVSYLLKFPSDP